MKRELLKIALLWSWLAVPSFGLQSTAHGGAAIPSLPTGGTPGSDKAADFDRRCNSPGVVRCFGFDDPRTTDPHIRAPWGESVKRAMVDADVKASGDGSLRFEIPPRTGADTSGNFSINFSDDLGTQFGSGGEFYVQWRQRFSPEFINTIYSGANGWKQVIIGEGDRPGFTANSCTQLEIVVQNTGQRGFPQMYHSCGGKDGNYEPLQYWNEKLGDIVLQQGDVTCTYREQKKPPCAGYLANQWMTFQVHVKIGTWYANNHVYHHDSVIQMWVAPENGPPQLVIDFRPGAPQGGYDLANENPEAKYGKIWLLPYNTNKSATQMHATAYTWYDELIISTRRIPDPK